MRALPILSLSKAGVLHQGLSFLYRRYVIHQSRIYRNAAQEGVWIRSFLEELGYRDLVKEPLVIKADNTAAESLSRDPTIHSRAKHLDVAYHWQRQQVERNVLQFEYVPSKDNAADGLTKPQARQLYSTFKDLIHLNEV